MEAFTQLLTGLVEHPVHCFLALALIAVAYLYKARQQDHKDFLDLIMKKNADHLETVAKVIPVAEKSADAVIAAERILAHLERTS